MAGGAGLTWSAVAVHLTTTVPKGSVTVMHTRLPVGTVPAPGATVSQDVA